MGRRSAAVVDRRYRGIGVRRRFTASVGESPTGTGESPVPPGKNENVQMGCGPRGAARRTRGRARSPRMRQNPPLRCSLLHLRDTIPALQVCGREGKEARGSNGFLAAVGGGHGNVSGGHRPRLQGDWGSTEAHGAGRRVADRDRRDFGELSRAVACATLAKGRGTDAQNLEGKNQIPPCSFQRQQLRFAQH